MDANNDKDIAGGRDVADEKVDAGEKVRAGLRDAVTSAAYGVGRVARAARDAVASPEGQRVIGEAKRACRRATEALGSAARKAMPVVRDAARVAVDKGVPAARRAAGRVADAAGSAVRGARPAARRAIEEVERARRRDGRPQTQVDQATGQPVETQVYVINEDGSRDYDVFPRRTAFDLGPAGRKVAGLLLILAGIPMLVLPGPGLAAILAGLALLGSSGTRGSRPGEDPDEQS